MVLGRISSAALGALLGALLTVIVYQVQTRNATGGRAPTGESGVEGASRELALRPGDWQRLTQDALRNAEPSDLQQNAAKDREALQSAQASLESLKQAVAEMKQRQSQLHDKLRQAEQELARREGSPKAKDEYDLDANDWKELAKVTGVKFRAPCPVDSDWVPKAPEVEELGLAPDDVEVWVKARRSSSARLNEVIKPACSAAAGPEVAAVLDNLTCLDVILNVFSHRDAKTTREALGWVSQINAGLMRGPTPEQSKNPVFAGYYAYTRELKAFQADLAESLGPERAKELAFSKACFNIIKQRFGPPAESP